MEIPPRPFEVKKIVKIVESKEVDDIVECINFLEIDSVCIGEGGNATVHIAKMPQFEKVCIKTALDKPQIICNDIHKEHEYQMLVREAGVRTPLTLIAIETNDKKDYLIMERVFGYSVREIIENPHLLPETFDYQKFCSSLDDQVNKMHFADIYHRDLHTGNVMINEEGLPVIIDFGTATKGTGTDFTYNESVTMLNSNTGRYELREGYFQDDNKMVKNIKSGLKKYMNKDALT